MTRAWGWTLALVVASARCGGSPAVPSDAAVDTRATDSATDTATDTAPAPQQRSVLLLILDDVGVDSVGLYADRDGDGAPDDGRSYAPTPNLQALCRAGVQFRQAWSAATCSPTRAQVLTGRFPFRTGVGGPTMGALGNLALTERTIPRVLDLNPTGDYAHANIGKWHLGALPAAGGTSAPNRLGWSHYAGSLSGTLPSYTAWDRVTNGASERVTEYATTVTVNDASRWLEAQREGRPWVLWVAFNAPHAPFHLPPAGLSAALLPGTEADIAARTPLYYRAALEALDREMGRLLRHPRVVTDRPLVVLFGDNGTPREAVEAPYNAARAKDTLYQGGLHVPLCVTGPGVAGGRQTDALANVADLYATVLDATSAARSTWEAPGQPIDSVSLWPLLQDPRAPAPRAWNFAEATLGPVVRNQGRAARDARYKLLRFNDGREELYDLSMDPRELTDLRARADTDPALGAAYRSLVAVFDRLR